MEEESNRQNFGLSIFFSPEYKGLIWKEKVPYEFLEPGKNFEENVIVYTGTPRKFQSLQRGKMKIVLNIKKSRF